MGLTLEDTSSAAIFLQIAEHRPDYAGLSYQKLAEVEDQWPPVGGGELYYGGTTYNNRQGLGAQLAPATQRGESFTVRWSEPEKMTTRGKLWLVPVDNLYDRGVTVQPSRVLDTHMADMQVRLNPEDAKRLGIERGVAVEMSINGHQIQAPARIEETVPKGQILLDRSSGVRAVEPLSVEMKPVK